MQDLRQRLAENATGARDAAQLRGLVQLRESEGFPGGTRPVAARVIARSPTVWYSTVKIDRGSSDGVRRNQPVIAAGGLAGKVTQVTGGTAEVTLITDASSAVSGQVMPNGANGIVKPEVGEPDDMLLDFVDKGRRVTEGTTVVTSGFTSSRVESLFPPDPHREGHEGGPRRGRALPARAHGALRRPPTGRLRAGAHREGRACRGRAGSVAVTATPGAFCVRG